MDDYKPFDPFPAPPEHAADTESAAPVDASPAPDEIVQAADAPPATAMPDEASLAASAAVMKFKSCRWRSDPEAGEFCTHRDVLPFAGKTAFNPESWCPECAFYKLRRTPKKRERVDYSY
jgi:hypothetical protein